MKVLEAPLDALSRDARAYPAHLLREGETGLCLFAAAFLGINDAIHMARMDMEVTCVDIRADRLEQMASVYPEDWWFHNRDAWEYAEQVGGYGKQWDVVSVDTFTGDATTRSIETMQLWMSLARRVVTMTVPHNSPFVRSEGPAKATWTVSRYERSNIADWMVLTRD